MLAKGCLKFGAEVVSSSTCYLYSGFYVQLSSCQLETLCYHLILYLHDHVE